MGADFQLAKTADFEMAIDTIWRTRALKLSGRWPSSGCGIRVFVQQQGLACVSTRKQSPSIWRH
jgi:hypothetical protein